jgi:hypothetical protein
LAALDAAAATKLAGIATGATANATDAQLRDRATHTGTQPHTTITGLGDAATRNVGTTAGTVAAGDDARLSDARPPTAHKHPLSDLTQSGAVRGQYMFWDGTAWTPHVPKITSTITANTITPDADTDIVRPVGALDRIITIANPVGTPIAGHTFTVDLAGGWANRRVVWGSEYSSGMAMLPVATTAMRRMLVTVEYDSATSAWRCMDVQTQELTNRQMVQSVFKKYAAAGGAWDFTDAGTLYSDPFAIYIRIGAGPVGAALDISRNLVPELITGPIDTYSLNTEGTSPPATNNSTTFGGLPCVSVKFPMLGTGGYAVSRASGAFGPVNAHAVALGSVDFALSRALTPSEVLKVLFTGTFGTREYSITSADAAGRWNAITNLIAINQTASTASIGCYVFAYTELSTPVTVYLRNVLLESIAGHPFKSLADAQRPSFAPSTGLTFDGVDDQLMSYIPAGTYTVGKMYSGPPSITEGVSVSGGYALTENTKRLVVIAATLSDDDKEIVRNWLKLGG